MKTKRSINAILILVLASGPLYSAPLVVTEEQQVDFGLAYFGANNCSVDWNGNLGGNCIGTGSQGLIRVSGDPNMSLDVDISKGQWAGNLRLKLELPKKNSFPYVTDATGELLIPVAGDLQMRNVAPGTYWLQYTITVFYQ